MIPTPNTNHLKRLEFESVYDPAEDTFLLLDALELDQTKFRSKTRLVLEIGSGSGCVSAFIASILGASSAAYICTDLSPPATLATLRTGESNAVTLCPILTDLTSSLYPRLHHAVDLLVFNPPYVETEEEEMSQAQEEVERGIQKTWAGGKEGMAVTERMLETVENFLSSEGLFYLVAVPQNKPEEIIERMRARGLSGEIVMKRRAGREHLMILRFQRS